MWGGGQWEWKDKGEAREEDLQEDGWIVCGMI